MKRIIGCAFIPEINRVKFDKWFLTFIGRKPTEEEYRAWSDKVNQIKKDMDAENIPVKSIDELRDLI